MPAKKNKVEVIAHRGASAYAPENTMAAFRLATEMGADWLELDCTLSKDGIVVVIHDDTVERTTGVSGRVREMTRNELLQLDAGLWMDLKYAGECIPTLDDVLAFVRKTHTGVYIEVKDYGDNARLAGELLELAGDRPVMDGDLIGEAMRRVEASGTRNLDLTRSVVRQVRKHTLEKRVVIQSFSPVVCLIAKYEAPRIRVGFLGSPDTPDAWEAFLRGGFLLDVDGFNPQHTALTPGRLAVLHAAGKSVAIWTVDEKEDMRRYATWGVDRIITNRPDVCLAILEELGKR